MWLGMLNVQVKPGSIVVHLQKLISHITYSEGCAKGQIMGDGHTFNSVQSRGLCGTVQAPTFCKWMNVFCERWRNFWEGTAVCRALPKV